MGFDAFEKRLQTIFGIKKERETTMEHRLMKRRQLQKLCKKYKIPCNQSNLKLAHLLDEKCLEVDYNKLCRNELQAMCKKHGIPARHSNVYLAEKLGELSKGGGTERPERVLIRTEKCEERANDIREIQETIVKMTSQADIVLINRDIEKEAEEKKQLEVEIEDLEKSVAEIKGKQDRETTMEHRLMKRRSLQKLCKKYKIPRNQSNLKLANLLDEKCLEVDYNKLCWNELQAIRKKHGIPARHSNVHLAEKLGELSKGGGTERPERVLIRTEKCEELAKDIREIKETMVKMASLADIVLKSYEDYQKKISN